MIGLIDCIKWQKASTNVDDDFHTDIVFLDVATGCMNDYVGIAHTRCAIKYQDFTGTFYFDECENKEICTFLIQKLMNDVEFYKTFESNAMLSIKALDRYWNDVELGEYKKDTYLKIYQEQLRLQKELYKKCWFMEILTNDKYGIENYLRKKLKLHLSTREIDELMYECISGTKLSPYAVFENEIRQIACKINITAPDFFCEKEKYWLCILNPEIKFYINELLKTYQYIFYHGFGNRKLLNENDILKMISDRVSSKTFNVIKSSNRVDFYLKKIKDDKLVRLINSYSKFSTIKAHRRLAQLKNFYFLDKLLWRISIRFNIQEYILRYMFPSEIIDLIKGNVDDNALNLIAERKKGMLYYKDKGITEIVLNSPNMSFIDEKINNAINKNKIYQGRAACRGVANGKIKKITRYSDSIQFEIGDILACREGDPDLIPLIIKSSGIITEQGGVTCHVAIIAREYNIPCIMGVGTFLDDFKDGEMICLDADNEVFFRR